MLSKDSYGSIHEGPEHEAEQSFVRLSPFAPQIFEGLLHGFPKFFPKIPWIKSEQPPVEAVDYVASWHHIADVLGSSFRCWAMVTIR